MWLWHFVSGAKIDKGHHATLAMKALNETVALSDAVQKAMDLTDSKDTLIVVTADHSHAFVINGYPNIDSDVLGEKMGFTRSCDILNYFLL